MSSATPAATGFDAFSAIAEMRLSQDEMQGGGWVDDLPLRIWPCLIVRHIGHFSEAWFEPSTGKHKDRGILSRDRLVRLAATAVAGAEAISRRCLPPGHETTEEVLKRVRRWLTYLVPADQSGGDAMEHVCVLTNMAGHLAAVCSPDVTVMQMSRAQMRLTQIAALAVHAMRDLEPSEQSADIHTA